MGRGKETKWKPRSSNLGYLVGCDYRAAFDRAIAEGEMVLEGEEKAAVDEARKSSPYADFGTCAHFHLQDGLRCVFPGPSAEFAPTADEMANAANLFGGDVNARDAMIREVALLAARHLPATPDGKPWFSEHSYTTKDISGHIDFVSQDSTVIVDLKTTSKTPPGCKAKPEHVVQLVAYYLLVKAKTGVSPTSGLILYVSSQAQWALPVWVDYTTEAMQAYIAQIADYIRYLRSVNLYRDAVPRFGAHCSDSWCPYKSMCRDKVFPSAGTLLEGAPKQQITSSPIFGKAST